MNTRAEDAFNILSGKRKCDTCGQWSTIWVIRGPKLRAIECGDCFWGPVQDGRRTNQD